MPGRESLIKDAKQIGIAEKIEKVLREAEIRKSRTKAALKQAKKARQALLNEVPTLDPLMRQFEDALARGDEPMVDLIREQITHFTGIRR